MAKSGYGTEFLDVLSAIPDPRLMHYGSYETVFLKRMRARHGGPREGSAAATAVEHAVNLLSFVFARIYFPTFSNGLKEIAGYLGFRWSGSPASGLEAIVWRHRLGGDPGTPRRSRRFSTTTEQDCEALELVANSADRPVSRGARRAEDRPGAKWSIRPT